MQTPPPPQSSSSFLQQTCKYPLDDSASSTLTLPDGRKLGYAQYGSPTGIPVFYIHGLPGSRIEAASLHFLAQELGLRIISADRPGYGWSSPHKGRGLVDFAKDLEYLAGALGVRRWSVLGISGGGPYALACAKHMSPSSLISVTLVCGLGSPDIGMKGADLVHRIGFGPFGYRYAPVSGIKWFFSREPAAQLHHSDSERFERQMALKSTVKNPKDLSFYDDEDWVRVFLASARNAFAQGFEGARDDGRVMCSPWGFEIGDIRKDLRVLMWYGRQDGFVPVRHGEVIKERLGEGARLRVEDETHSSIWFGWKREIFGEIVEVWREGGTVAES